MQRYDFYFRQKVSEGELDGAFDACESAEFNTALGLGAIGIQAGAVVTQHTPNNLTVDISGSATIRDKLGQRIAFGPAQTVDVSVDELAVSTAVTTPGNNKIVSVFAKFKRTLTDPRIDGNSVTVYFNRAESFEFVVRQGAESAPPATPTALDAEYILICDIRRSFGQTAITNADITPPGGSYTGITNRREDAFVITVSGDIVRAGTAEQAIEDSIAAYVPSGAASTFVGTENWDGGGPLVSTNVSDAVNEIVGTLAAEADDADGASQIGAEQQLASTVFTGAMLGLSAGRISDQMFDLLALVNGLFRTRTVTGAHTIDAGGIRDATLFLNPSAAFNVTLPNPATNKGRRLRLVDISGDMTNPLTDKKVTLVRYGSEQINGYGASLPLSADYGQWEVVCDGTNWFVA